MSDYRFQVTKHNDIDCLRIMIDGEEIAETHIPLDDILTSMCREGLLPTMKALAEYDKYISLVTDETACVFCGGPVDWRLHTTDITLFHRDTCPVVKAREMVARV